MSVFEHWKQAILNGDVELVRSLFESHPELTDRANEQAFSFDSSAVFHCRNNLPLIDLLLEHGANLNQKTGWSAGGFGIVEGVSPEVAEPLIERGAIVDIWAAVSLDMVEPTKQLLATDPKLIRAPGGDGKHPLHYAQNAAMVDLLVAAGADVDARDVDHTSTPAQYLVDKESVARRLLDHGAGPDIFLATALGDLELVDQCLAADPDDANARLGTGKWTTDGNIYNWTLGHDVTPLDVARERNHEAILARLQSACTPRRLLMDAIWHGEVSRIDKVLDQHPDLLTELTEDDRGALARAAWWYRPVAVEQMLRLGFDPHVPGAHDSTPLDRAAFHGYCDIVEMLLRHDPAPPLSRKNEFGGTPLGACLWGFRHGWDTGFPQDHYATVKLLLEAGARRPPDAEPIGDARLDELLEKYRNY